MWPDNTVLIIISASVLLVHSLPSNIILNTVQDDSNSVVQNEKYLQLFLQLATRAADNLIRLRNQTDKNHDCNKSRDNLLSTIEDPRIQPATFEANLEQFGEIQNEIQSHLFSSNSENKTENTSSNAAVHDDEVSSSGTTQKSVFNSDTEEATASANESNPDVQSSEIESTEIDGIAERFFNSFNLQNIKASASINDSSDEFKNKFFSQTSNLERSTLERSEQLYNKTDRTLSDAVEYNDEVSTSSKKSIFEHSDTKSATTKESDSNSDAQNSESSEVDEIGERFFNPFNLQTPHALVNDLKNTGNKVLAQTHNLLQSTLERSKQVNNTLCLQKLSSKLDDTSDILDLPLDKLRENILNPQVTNSPSVLHQIVSSAINVVNSVIEKLPASFSNATLFKQIIPHNLEKLRTSLNDTNLFDQIIPHTNFTNTPLKIVKEFSEDISKSGLEFISALRSRVNELSSHDNQNVESKSEVNDAGKTNTIERDDEKLNTELLFTDNSKIQSNNGQSTTENHESTLAPLPKVLSNSDDHKEHTDKRRRKRFTEFFGKRE